jgi:hypothetical protein
MTLISIFGKDVEEARKALKSKLLLSVVLACVFFGERAIGHAASGFRFAQSWIETKLEGDVWTPNVVDAGFLNGKLDEYKAFVSEDTDYWVNSGLIAAPWPLAQDVMASPEAAIEQKEAILAVFKKATMAKCVCWSENGVRGHIGASAWVTLALAQLGGDQRDAALDDIISKQGPSGSWALFAEASNDPQNASTYATATAIMAIKAHIDAGFVVGERKVKAQRAMMAGGRWLIKTYSYTEKGWMDYPYSNEGRTQSLGLTSQAVWILHKIMPTTELTRIDQTFIERTDLDTKMKDFDISDVGIYFGKSSLDYDNTRYARHPWTLLALKEGYPNFDTKQRVTMRTLIGKAMSDTMWRDREREREYMMLELLFAYRRLLTPPSNSSSAALILATPPS